MSEIVLDVDLPHPPERVWRALTDPDVLAGWFMSTDLVARTGGRHQAYPAGTPGFTGPFDIEVDEVIPVERLAMRWTGDQLHAQVVWELERTGAGCRLHVAQSGFLGVNGTVRRRELRRAYAEMFEDRLPRELDRLAQREIPRQRGPELMPAGRANAGEHHMDNELPSAASPVHPSDLRDPSDPWALSDPGVSAGVGLEPVGGPIDESTTPPEHGDRRRRPGAFGAQERVRVVAIAVTVAMAVVTVGWLWLTRPVHHDAPPGTATSPAATGVAGFGDQPALQSPTPGASGSLGGGVQPSGSANPGTSGDPATQTSGSAAPSPAGSAEATPGTPEGQPALTAEYATQSSTGLLGYTVAVTVTIHNRGTQARPDWKLVLTVPSGANLDSFSSSVSAKKDGGTVTVTPRVGELGAGSDTAFSLTFSGGSLLGIGSGGVTGCTIDGVACSKA
ncbi:SRPBCC domain-containing protein [Hamadaea tsunoensis]|uniref:SRPBCC domain-containing protein n=1 Tax=Hamadaea tsunoensis TaxID=53368 RepID=UPI0006841DED|nr:SRPBCC domain-containing protein [Hamadaea tsunoensis]